MTRVRALIQRYPLLALLLPGLAVWGYLSWFAGVAPVAAPSRVAEPPPPKLPISKALVAKEWVDVQQRTEEQARELRDMKRLLQQQTQEHAQERAQEQREREQREQHQRQEFATTLQATLDAHTATLTQELARMKAAAKPPVATPVAPRPVAPTPTPAPAVPTLELLEQKSQTWTAGAAALPEAVRADTAYLPAGSFAEIKVISGVFATSRAGWARDIIVSLAQPFHPPRHLHGPEQRTDPTEVNLAGCYALGTAEGDMSSGRVYGRMTTLSCVFPDLRTVEQPIKGVLLGADGTLGLVGRFEMQDTAYLARTFLVSLMSGAAEAFALSKRQVITTPFGGTTSVTTGSNGEFAGYSALARATADLSKFYMQQAERLLPTLWVEAGARGKVAVTEGVALDGYPTQIRFVHGGR